MNAGLVVTLTAGSLLLTVEPQNKEIRGVISEPEDT